MSRIPDAAEQLPKKPADIMSGVSQGFTVNSQVLALIMDRSSGQPLFDWSFANSPDQSFHTVVRSRSPAAAEWAQTPRRSRFHRYQSGFPGAAVRAGGKGTLRPHRRPWPRDREPSHRQRRRPPQRPGPQSRNRISCRLRVGRTPRSVRPIPEKQQRDRNTDPWPPHRSTRRRDTPQYGTHRGQGSHEGKEDPTMEICRR